MKWPPWSGKMPWLVKSLAKLDNLNSVFVATLWKERSSSPKLSPDLHKHAVPHHYYIQRKWMNKWMFLRGPACSGTTSCCTLMPNYHPCLSYQHCSKNLVNQLPLHSLLSLLSALLVHCLLCFHSLVHSTLLHPIHYLVFSSGITASR